MPAASKKQILLVEDEACVRMELRELLEDEGYAVIEACNGRQALEAIAEGAQPQAVVLDLVMPEMDGWEFLERLRMMGVNVPVVLNTAVDLYDVPRNFPYVRKPNCVQPLLDLLQTTTA